MRGSPNDENDDVFAFASAVVIFPSLTWSVHMPWSAEEVKVPFCNEFE